MNIKKLSFPLSQPQMRIWYTEKMYPNTSIGNITGVMRIKKNLDMDLLNRSIQLLYQTNETLRIRLTEEDGSPLQYVAEYSQKDVLHYYFENERKLDEWAQHQAEKPFDLYEKSLSEICTFTLGNNETGFFVKIHHVISDAWTMTLIGNMILDIYNCLNDNKEYVRNSEYSYKDYVEKELRYIKSDKVNKSKEFWNKKFSRLSEPTSLTFKSSSGNLCSRRLSYLFDDDITKGIMDYCNRENISVYTFFLSVLNLYISHVTRQDDITILTSVHNRNSFKDKNTLGMYVSTVPLKTHLSFNTRFTDFAKKVANEQFSVFRHQRYPYNFLSQDIRKLHNISLHDSYQILFSYQNVRFVNPKYEFESKWYFNGYQEMPITIHINDRENKGQLLIDFDYRVDLFDKEDVNRLYKQIGYLIENILKYPEAELCTQEILPSIEKEEILYNFNQTDAPYTKGKTLTEIFEGQVEKRPNQIAATFNNESLTFTELNDKSNQIAHLLKSKGVKADCVVGIMMERSLDMIVAIFGILKAGGAYLPIVPEFPIERLKYVLEDSQINIILTHDCLVDSLGFFEGEILAIDTLTFDENHKRNIAPVHNEKNLAYVIYTSGSTGKPKGVMVEHYSVINRVEWMIREYEFSERDVILQKTPFVFDVSVWELFSWAFVGARLCFLKQGDEKEPLQIAKTIEREGVTRLHFVPSMLTVFLDELDDSPLMRCLKTLRSVFTSGEALNVKHVQRFNKSLYRTHGTTLNNLYGPTEATVDVTFFNCPPGNDLDIVPIGRPIQNVHLYVVNTHNQLQPIGVPGELCISGDCLARGYINKPDITAEKFVENPFVPGTRMYKTGDLVRWMSDGKIEYLGRMDNQVKVRGYRIELGEIEAQLVLHDEIKEVVVVCHVRNGESYLIAYLVSEGHVSVPELKNFLLKTLPEYMIPTTFEFIKKMPLTINGKVDRKSLPQITRSIFPNSIFIKPNTTSEKSLVKIWCEVLDMEEVGIENDFFELGGHSLLATKVVSRIRNQFEVDISLREFYNHPTISGLASWLESLNSKKQGNQKIKRVERKSRIRS
ncbi:amino acid adenylation domain-containing protein [Peribacillus frigoritolerans]|uniref:non-ribosomal peptide synthetase n=1 Tax=Peribacillus frigoritolerans TaxID=450367 RepID=UPI002EBA2905|nr:amino acid adenylation domain-containing protein [Peribacillus frigoritolerans]